MKKALLIGATGLVGSELLNELLNSEEYQRVMIITRRKIDIFDEKVEQHVIDFDRMDELKELFRVEAVFCTLGTTMKKSGTKEQFVKVDFDYPLKAAQIAIEQGVSQFFIVTAMGANQHSRFFYNQVKGNVEEAIKQLDFQSLYIIRPSLLLGHRSEARLGEDFGKAITKRLPFIFNGPLQKYKPNHACDVAKAMLKLSLQEKKGTFLIESNLIEEYS